MPDAFRPSDRNALCTVLERQQRRCEVHHVWSDAFRGVLRGTMTLDAFQGVLPSVVRSLDDVSSFMRRVRDDGVLVVVEKNEAASAENGSVSPSSPSTSSSSRPEISDAVRQWVGRLQLAERALFESTVVMQKVATQHLHAAFAGDGNATSCSESQDVGCSGHHHCRKLQRPQHCVDCGVALAMQGVSGGSLGTWDAPSRLSIQAVVDDEMLGSAELDEAAESERRITASCRRATQEFQASTVAMLKAKENVQDLMDEVTEWLVDMNEA